MVWSYVTMSSLQPTTEDRFKDLALGYSHFFNAFPHLFTMEERIAEIALQAKTNWPERRLKILDLGIGKGHTTFALARLRGNMEIIGVDKSSDMIRDYNTIAKELRMNIACIDRNIVIDLYEMDAMRYLQTCEPCFFDIVISGFALHNLPRAERFFLHQQIWKSLKKDGRFVNGDKIARDDSDAHRNDMTESLGKIFAAFNTPELEPLGRKWIEHYLRDNEPDLLQTETEAWNVMNRTGFKNILLGDRYLTEAIIYGDA